MLQQSIRRMANSTLSKCISVRQPGMFVVPKSEIPPTVHQQPATGQLSVIGILFDWSDRDNPLLEELWGHNPSQPTGQVRPYALIDSVLQGGYFHYVGSLTTPPCSEDVLWLMLQSDSTISHAQMDRWKYRTPSNRPIQSNPGTLWAVSAGRKA